MNHEASNMNALTQGNGHGESAAHNLKLPTLSCITMLVINVKEHIGDDYRASDEDTLPSIQLTVGADEKGWDYQTGDNSYSGGAYLHRFWGVVTVYRRSNSRELAREILEQIKDQAVYAA